MKIVECVPNISEGRRPEVYNAVAAAAETVAGVKVLNIDPGAETNRTVITIVGPPEAIVEAGVRFTAKARELIDMTRHQGAHARFGAVDVFPFVPVVKVTMEECVELAHQLGKRLGEELGLPVYLYEFAASKPDRKNLAVVRAGEYEGLAQKLKKPEWAPDYGPAEFIPGYGATAVGARKFLVAYNVNLNTLDYRLANRVAFDVREKGRKKKDEYGRILKDEKGEPILEPGMLEAVKAVGWAIPEFGCAQISMNLTDLDVTPVHAAFDACEQRATARGMRVTGSEIVGLIPKQALIDAGYHYLRRMGRSAGVPEKTVLHVAARTMGFSEVKPYDPKTAVIEYMLAPPSPLADMSLSEFTDELSSDSPAPGGGSVSALIGAQAAGLAAMVSNLSFTKLQFKDRFPELDRIGVASQRIKDELLAAIDEDTRAFDGLLEAMRLPRKTEEQKAARQKALLEATVRATEVPLGVLEACPEIMELCLELGRIGLQSSLSDAGTGIQAARAAAAGAYLNVCINLSGLDDKARTNALLERADQAWAKTKALHRKGEEAILERLRAEAEK